MEGYERFYRNFERPPLAPVFRPTAEEFADPIAYVHKIRFEAEQYGVVKIVPPEAFKPPFVIDREAFEFTPRIQRLNEIEAIVRERLIFSAGLDHYWRLQGVEYRIPWVDNKFLDLFRLHKMITEIGGCEEVTKRKQWSLLAKKLKIKTTQGPTNIRIHYQKLVDPYIKHLEEKVLKKEEPNSEDEDVKCEEGPSCSGPSMQGGGRRRQRQSRMMAGGVRKTNTKAVKTPPKKKSDPMESVYCAVCNQGDDEPNLLLCEDCDKSIHTHCCTPPHLTVPKGEWRCPDCVTMVMKKSESEFGFYDAEAKYNLVTFADFANNFKKEHFNVEDPRDVDDELVEKSFWKHIISNEAPVEVKYGADLITSKVGSGFPRKQDDYRGCDSKLRSHYALHPWNLNNMPILRESVLSHIETGISGMMVPWVYVGMCFSTFCWHTEDHWTYSINYNHWGERKIWYGVAGTDAEKFENIVRELAPGLTKRQNDIFHHMTTAVNPALLRSKGLEVYTVHQNAGEFVITFPRAYHAGYNEGLNFAEAVNFAPIDWLRMGRLCVGDYALVRRPCVFAHDELVWKMVSACDKLCIPMSLAAYDELKEILSKETRGRRSAKLSGIEDSKLEIFEQLADDSRTCRYCNTTVFLSAVTCAHDRIVCLDHIDHLCKKCKSTDCILKYRFTIDELQGMTQKLNSRTTLYTEWKTQVDKLLNNKKLKPMLSAVENLLETARLKRFPHSPQLIELMRISKACNSNLEAAKTLLNGKIRTRDKTRKQRADTRLDLNSIQQLKKELGELPCEIGGIIKQIDCLVMRLNAWQVEARKVINSVKSGTTAADVEQMQKLMLAGEEFDVRMNELDQLQQSVHLMQWREEADPLLNWEYNEEEQGSEAVERWNIEQVGRLIETGSRLLPDDINGPVSKLHSMRKQALCNDATAEKFLAKKQVTLNELLATWEDLKSTEWCSSKGLNSLREEMLKVSDVQDQALGTDTTLCDSTELARLCSESRYLANSQLHKEQAAIKDRLTEFTQRLCALFKKSNSYYNLAQIIRERDDVAALAEGQTMSLSLYTPESPVDEWHQLDEFESIEAMKNHQGVLRAQQPKLLGALQAANSARSVRETCSCATHKDSEKDGGILECFVCRAKYHGTCCEWDSFLSRLPEGSFLCVRCLRGRRPLIEDLSAACKQAPSNALEVALVKDAINNANTCLKTAYEIGNDLAKIGTSELPKELEHKVIDIIQSTLSCEVMNLDLLTKVATFIPTIFSDLLEKQKRAWNLLRERPARASPPSILFQAPRKGKRSAGNHESRKEKKKNRGYHEDDSTCSAEQCIQPLSDQVNWIQCVGDECGRWYHLVCVGVTVMKAKSLHFECPVCDVKNGK